MNKQETYQYLKDHNIPFEITEHRAVYNMEELESIDLPYPEGDAKNLFVWDDKKKNYYLITVKGDKRVNLKDFWKAHGLRPLSFASPEDLKKYMDLTPGAVTPLGLLNVEGAPITMYLDTEFKDSIIGIHPNENTATVWLQGDDLVELLRENGCEVEIVEI